MPDLFEEQEYVPAEEDEILNWLSHNEQKARIELGDNFLVAVYEVVDEE